VIPFEYVDPTLERKIETAKVIIQTAISVGFTVNYILNLVLGGALGGIWEMINTLQIIYYMPLLSLDYTYLFVKCIKILDIVNADFPFPFAKEIVGLLVDIEKIDDVPYSESFLEFGIENSSFVLAYYNKLALWMCLICCYPIVLLFKRMISNNWLSKKLYAIDCTFRYNGVIQIFIELYLELAIISSLGLF